MKMMTAPPFIKPPQVSMCALAPAQPATLSPVL